MQGTTLEQQYAMIDRPNLERLKAIVQKGCKLPMPVLDYVGRVQEGRHRAVLAEELGIDRIPVLVVQPI